MPTVKEIFSNDIGTTLIFYSLLEFCYYKFSNFLFIFYQNNVIIMDMRTNNIYIICLNTYKMEGIFYVSFS